MKPTVLKTWAQFDAAIESLRKRELERGRKTDFLFRGLHDSKWPLTTTLEREGFSEMPVARYYESISAVRPEIESVAGRKWALRALPDIYSQMRTIDGVKPGIFPSEDEYSYLVYLRHHGFPSPLLDWTSSPYVAAFFAFRAPDPTADGAGKYASIYVYSETPVDFKGNLGGRPRIEREGHYVSTHRRHFLQQCDYTMCFVRDDQWRFAPHDAVFNQRNPYQDVLWRFDIPRRERLNVLRHLDSFNLNAFSLFQSEDALMETMALREFYLNAPRD